MKRQNYDNDIGTSTETSRIVSQYKKRNLRKKWLISIGTTAMLSTTLLTNVGLPLIQANNIVYADYNYGGKNEDCDIDTSSSKSDDDSSTSASSSSSAASAGDWTQEGTETYKVAQQVFTILTTEYGTSGAFAAGVLGNIAQESGFYPDRSQGAGIVRFGMNSKTPPSNDGGGGGLFQFTPYTKFTDSEYWGKVDKEGWGVANQIAFMWASEWASKEIEAYFYKTGDSTYANAEALISADDPGKAAEYFQMAYERPAAFHAERAQLAEQANSIFNKNNVKADKSKWRFNGNSTTSASTTVDTSKSSSDDKTKSDTDCDDVTVGESTSSGGAWGTDGTGSHTQATYDGWGLAWRPAELPDELKQYAIDPKSLGMQYSSITGWPRLVSGINNQCTDLAASLMYLLWLKDGKSSINTRGNGIDVVSNAVADYGGKATTDSPHAGAVFSNGGGGNHVGVVSHVFENGDILIVEQNSPKSGQGAGETATWNYRLITPAGYKSQGMEFWYPGDYGYTVNTEAKTL